MGFSAGACLSSFIPAMSQWAVPQTPGWLDAAVASPQVGRYQESTDTAGAG